MTRKQFWVDILPATHPPLRLLHVDSWYLFRQLYFTQQILRNFLIYVFGSPLKCLIEETDESDEKYNYLNLVDRKLWEEYALTNHRQTPGKNGFEATERLLLSNIENLSNSLPTIDDLVPMTVVNHKAIHEFILQKCKEQTMTFTKKFKLRGNSPQINKLKTELTRLINNGGDNGEEILSLEDQILYNPFSE